MKEINYLDLFSGIGGFPLGLLKAGFTFNNHYYSEIDKYAIRIYKRHFPIAMKLGDINGISSKQFERPDIITLGFPCQDMSIAGTREGFGGQRSSLFFRAIEIIDEVKPKYFIFENVKGLFSSNKGRDFEEVLQTISNIGYDGQWQLLNTKWVLPQNRERIYFIGYPRGNRRPEIFPIGEGEFNTKNEKRNELIELTHNESDAKRVYSSDGIAKTLKAVGGGLGAKTGLYQVGVTKRNNEIIESDISNAVDANYHKGLDQHQQRTGVKINSSIRRLTPMECERLQGFPDNWTEGISDTQRYKVIGNAVSVPIVELIMRRLYDQF
jgi:DNA (cytosine-5)-methyltransferase 1